MSGQIHISSPAKLYITNRHCRRVHPLPTPVVGHLTGLTCPDCPLTSTSQLRYHPPRFPNPANINWKCHQPDSHHVHGKGYVRTLKLEHLINKIRAINAGAQPPPAPGSLSGLLNVSNEEPDHLKRKTTSQLCPGYLGRTGATHQSTNKSNMKCSLRLCLLCCQMVQRVHGLTCNFKAHVYTPLSSGDHDMSSPAIRNFVPFGLSNVLDQGSSQHVSQSLVSFPRSSQSLAGPSGSQQATSKQIQSAQANRAVTSTLTPSQLSEYHENLKAVDLVAKSRDAAKREAARTIWVELWTKPGSSTLINAEAPNWPLFSLQECQILLDKCRKAMSDKEDWESEIEVWNMEQFRWVSLAPTCTSKYPPIPRKILVQLESISDNDCLGLSDAILKMTTEGPYEPLTTPARCILTVSPNPPKISYSSLNMRLPAPVPAVPRVQLDVHTSTEPATPESSPLPSPRTICLKKKTINSKDSEIEWIGSSDLQVKVSLAIAESKKGQEYLARFEGSPWVAWVEFFGELYDYGHTTVYRVKKWINLVGEEQLELDTRTTPSLTLIAARKMYQKEWLATKTKRQDQELQPKQKREVEDVQQQDSKRRKVVVDDNARSDVQSDGDSDVQIMNN
ncbi:uncharacterized protein MELLADRAFT_64643 [Melampsora larici-populina 98AG31]|uniref:Uncharacterized protein n=1 Tax=Melampsora larici-populina (strain 98AG31 / pathotype 3-4-7) TaxID=747676 RepID=F4RS88_MELLP|nr:uncharacterized protein MELLADRAFT_64643 [Melampsora larici-populina 98AG31]EGG04812.1 hypothetical protein MELLADRAFT_64643 [Melampsora larici-populina 98AG31]